MKTRFSILLLFAAMIVSLSACSQGTATGQKEPWSSSQLLEPADLAKTINDPKAQQPLIYCIGPQSVIKGSIYIGPTHDAANLQKFREQLKNVPKDANIVIYCGCCPFSRCPNVRPAFKLLNEMQFKNQKLLDLKTNVKTDWIDKGYPLSD